MLTTFSRAGAHLTATERIALGEVLRVTADRPGLTLLPLENKVPFERIRKLVPLGDVCVCDFYLDGIERHPGLSAWADSLRVEDGRGVILNVDHHSDLPRMRAPISSGNLAITFVREHGPISPLMPLIINHTDADSVISALIMRGILPPREEFGEAVIAADHTGAANDIADLLQAIEQERSLALSMRNLGLLLSGQPLEPRVQELLDERRANRERARRVAGTFESAGSVRFLLVDEHLAGELVPPFLPEAAVIMIGRVIEHGNLEIKIRRGLAAVEGITLKELAIEQILPEFGGRWNAGSTRRGGGSPVPAGISPGSFLRARAELIAAAYDEACRGAKARHPVDGGRGAHGG